MDTFVSAKLVFTDASWSDVCGLRVICLTNVPGSTQSQLYAASGTEIGRVTIKYGTTMEVSLTEAELSNVLKYGIKLVSENESTELTAAAYVTLQINYNSNEA